MENSHQTDKQVTIFPEIMVEEVEQHWDCLIIGAGISGLDAAYHLKVFIVKPSKARFKVKTICGCGYFPT